MCALTKATYNKVTSCQIKESTVRYFGATRIECSPSSSCPALVGAVFRHAQLRFSCLRQTNHCLYWHNLGAVSNSRGHNVAKQLCWLSSSLSADSSYAYNWYCAATQSKTCTGPSVKQVCNQSYGLHLRAWLICIWAAPVV